MASPILFTVNMNTGKQAIYLRKIYFNGSREIHANF